MSIAPAPAPRLLCVVAARPTLMKMAPVVAALRQLEPAPVLTLVHTGQRDATERPITISEGGNALAGCDPAVVLALCDDILQYGGKAGRVPRLWDGQASPRIAAVPGLWLAQRRERAL